MSLFPAAGDCDFTVDAAELAPFIHSLLEPTTSAVADGAATMPTGLDDQGSIVTVAFHTKRRRA